MKNGWLKNGSGRFAVDGSGGAASDDGCGSEHMDGSGERAGERGRVVVEF